MTPSWQCAFALWPSFGYRMVVNRLKMSSLHYILGWVHTICGHGSQQGERKGPSPKDTSNKLRLAGSGRGYIEECLCSLLYLSLSSHQKVI